LDSFRTKSLAIGGYRYGVVICKVRENYWQFYPLRTMDSKEAVRVFREFCGQLGYGDKDSIAQLTVYCDAGNLIISRPLGKRCALSVRRDA